MKIYYEHSFTPLDYNSPELLLYKRPQKTYFEYERNDIAVNRCDSLQIDFFLKNDLLYGNEFEVYKNATSNNKYLDLILAFRRDFYKRDYISNKYDFLMISRSVSIILEVIIPFVSSDIQLTITSDESALFQFSVGNKNIYLEYFFSYDQEDVVDVEAVCNVYEDSENIYAYGGNLEEVLAGCTAVVGKSNLQYKPSTEYYDLSEKTHAETIL